QDPRSAGMARHLAPFSCRQTIAEIVRRRSWGGVLPLGRHASISGSRSIHAPSVSIALSSFQEGQNARHHNQFKLEQALATIQHLPVNHPSAKVSQRRRGPPLSITTRPRRTVPPASV